MRLFSLAAADALPRESRSTERSYGMAAKALSFDVGDYVVYPKHGVGRVIELQRQEI
uniref:CarD family transcriptional regulator n=1 Tax=Pseudomonas aeruginosa TaxID=287 RepID=UPI003C6DFC89